MKNQLSRRHFLKAVGVAGAFSGLVARATTVRAAAAANGRPALIGGTPVRSQPFPSWPVITAKDEEAWMEVFRTKRWNRLNGTYVDQFEKAWAERVGTQHCVATSSGTSALVTSVNALEIGPGDEVIVPPYTFVATINAVLLQHALPVFVDSDRETFQIDARKIEAAITKRTRCVLPVHLGGASADLDTILSVARKHSILVLEDACQSHLGEWRGRKVGTWGDLGCFSFQASKNLNSGEGGAIVGNNATSIEVARSFHNQGRAAPDAGFAWARNGDNRRLTEFQGALLLAQLTRLEEQSRTRETNAAYLTKLLGEIPGIQPARMIEGCTRNAYHLYMFRYAAAQFRDLPRQRFLKALQAEGVPCSAGYSPLNKEPFLKQTLNSRGFRHIYSETEIKALEERNVCPENDKLCQEAVWLTQNMLLGSKGDMEQIAEAVRKVQTQSALLVHS
jgi:dTDP-4-amino-4,6-dideoxygalactose transaminase